MHEPHRISKLAAPALRGRLRRHDVSRHIEASGARIVWLEGPGGWGKTVAVAQHIEALGAPAIWYRVDARDRDPASFFFFFRQAVAMHAALGADELPALTADRAEALEHFVRTWFEHAFARLPAGCAVVIDDWHEAAGPVWELVMRVGLSAGPPDLRLFVTSRTAAPASLARLSAAGEVLRLTPSDLAFTVAETAGLLAEIGGTAASADPDAAAALTAATGGWPAAIALRAEAGRSDSEELVFDYLASEVFGELDEADQELLLALAEVPPASAAVLGVLLERSDVYARLAALERRHLFVTRLADRDGSWALHDLFAAFLRNEVRRRRPEEARRAFAKRAAHALAAANAPEDAVAVAVAADCWEVVAELLDPLGAHMLAAGRQQQLLRWLRAAGDFDYERLPWLTYWRGAALLVVDPWAALTALREALLGFRRLRDARGAHLAWAELQEAISVGLDVRLMDEGLRLIEDLDRDLPRDDSDEHLSLRVASAMLATLTYRRPLDPATDAWGARAQALAMRSADLPRRAFVAGFLAMRAYNLGEVARGEAALRTLAPERRLLPPFHACVLDYCAGLLTVIAGDGARAVDDAQRGLAVVAETRVAVWEPMLRGLSCWARLQAGERDEAVAAELARAEEAARSSGPLASAATLLARIWLALARRRPNEALPIIATWERETIEFGYDLNLPMIRLASARAARQQGDLAAAKRHLDEADVLCQRHGAFGHRFGVLCERATLALEEGAADADADAALREALEWARPRGLGGFMLWDRDDMSALCARALARGVCADVAELLVRRHHLARPSGAGGGSGWPARLRVRLQGAVRVERDGVAVDLGPKTPQRLLELLAAVATSPGGVATARVIDWLWPDSDGDASSRALRVTLHRLRKLLGDPDALVLREGVLRLAPERCSVDAWDLAELAAAAGAGRAPERAALLQAYGGALAAGLGDPWWLLEARQRQERSAAVCLGALRAEAQARGADATAELEAWVATTALVRVAASQAGR